MSDEYVETIYEGDHAIIDRDTFMGTFKGWSGTYYDNIIIEDEWETPNDWGKTEWYVYQIKGDDKYYQIALDCTYMGYDDDALPAHASVVKPIVSRKWEYAV